MLTSHSTSSSDAWLGFYILVGDYDGTPPLTGLLFWNGQREKIIFQVQNNVKTNRSLSKRAGLKTGLLLPQSVVLTTPKEELLSELLWWNQSVTEMLGRSSNESGWVVAEWKYTKYESTSLTAHHQRKYNCVCLLHASVSTAKKKQWWRVQTCFSF